MAIPVSNINQTRTLREIWLNPGISRIDLANLLSLNKSSVSKIIQELIDSNMVKTGEEGVPGPMGGRKPVELNLDPNFGCFAGIELNEEILRISCLDFTGKTIFETEKRIAVCSNNLIGSVQTAIDLINSILSTPILGAIIGLQGIIDRKTGTILRSIPLEIKTPYDLGNKLKKLYPFPVLLENDANCCCWGEIVLNKKRNLNDFLYILGEERESEKGKKQRTRGPVFGLGLAFSGRVYHGTGQSAGEFKSIFTNGSNTSQLSLNSSELNSFFEDEEIQRKGILELARNIALIVNVLNLDKVILGGFFHSFDKSYLEIIEQEVLKNNSYPDTQRKIGAFSAFGSSAVSVGAASYGIERFFNISGHFDSDFKLVT